MKKVSSSLILLGFVAISCSTSIEAAERLEKNGDNKPRKLAFVVTSTSENSSPSVAATPESIPNDERPATASLPKTEPQASDNEFDLYLPAGSNDDNGCERWESVIEIEISTDKDGDKMGLGIYFEADAKSLDDDEFLLKVDPLSADAYYSRADNTFCFDTRECYIFEIFDNKKDGFKKDSYLELFIDDSSAFYIGPDDPFENKYYVFGNCLKM